MIERDRAQEEEDSERKRKRIQRGRGRGRGRGFREEEKEEEDSERKRKRKRKRKRIQRGFREDSERKRKRRRKRKRKRKRKRVETHALLEECNLVPEKGSLLLGPLASLLLRSDAPRETFEGCLAVESVATRVRQTTQRGEEEGEGKGKERAPSSSREASWISLRTAYCSCSDSTSYFLENVEPEEGEGAEGDDTPFLVFFEDIIDATFPCRGGRRDCCLALNPQNDKILPSSILITTRDGIGLKMISFLQQS